MTAGQRDLIRYRMERACETLQEARLMLDGGHLQSAFHQRGNYPGRFGQVLFQGI
jgi:hypothetical protein